MDLFATRRAPQPARKPRDSALGVRPRPRRHRQALNQRGRQVPAHQHPNDSVEHVAVEQAAEEVLLFDGDLSAQAEQRVCRRRLGRDDGGDEGQPIRHAGDIAIRQAIAREASRSNTPPRDLTIDAKRRAGDVCRKGPDVFALEHRQTAGAKTERDRPSH